ncbi:hypothetical protein AN216_04235 [Streptomyces oceani]|uniref:MalT-like TPR region domain-containing protein n=1 Tax=Streptomyces oceani TaxID=1075402 RepID=A0A1E7KMQ2_9ACTN|nr:hypothetical protein AN216_04235 [Streptomyces oceani]
MAPALVAEGAFQLGAMAAEAGEHERAAEFLKRTIATSQPEFTEQAREPLIELDAKHAEDMPEEKHRPSWWKQPRKGARPRDSPARRQLTR